MEILPRPTIKGIYVKSHIDALRAALGDNAVILLKDRVGFPIDYGDDDDVFVGDEEEVINQSVMMLHPGTAAEKLHNASGRLHFVNWTATPWSKQLFSLLPPDFKYMMLHINVIILKIFKNMVFSSEDLGPRTIKISSQNNYYHIDHWVGLYQAWMEAFGLKGTVAAQVTGDHMYDFILTWDELEKQPVA